MEAQNNENTIRSMLLSPFEWGLIFAYNNGSTLIKAAILPAVIELASAFLDYFYPIPERQKPLLGIMLVMVDAWFLGAIAMVAIEIMQGKRPDAQSSMVRAFYFLPKIFFSYFAVLLSGALAFFFPVAFVLLVFFMWAPLFVVAETYVVEPVKEEDDDDLGLDDEMAAEERYKARLRRELSYFTGKAIWDVGLARSLRFGARFFAISLQFTLLFCFAYVVPLSLFLAVAGGKQTLLILFLQATSAKLLHVFAIGAWAGTFLVLIPGEAKDELSLKPYLSRPELTTRQLTLFRWVQKRRFFFSLLLIATLLSAMYLAQVAHLQARMPPGVKSELISAEKVGEQFVVRFRLTDSKEQFRWLSPERFRVVCGSGQEPAKPSSGGESGSDRQAEAKDKFNALRVEFSTDDGRKLGDDFKPSYKPLILAAWFRQTQDMPDSGSFELFYDMPKSGPFAFLSEGNDDTPKKLFDGRYGS